jgi:hypothetical protein
MFRAVQYDRFNQMMSYNHYVPAYPIDVTRNWTLLSCAEMLTLLYSRKGMRSCVQKWNQQTDSMPKKEWINLRL